MIEGRGPLRVGDVVHGHLDGWFGRDHYDCARVEAVGADWAVLRNFNGGVCTGSGVGIVAVLETARDAAPTGWDASHSSGCPDGERG